MARGGAKRRRTAARPDEETVDEVLDEIGVAPLPQEAAPVVAPLVAALLAERWEEAGEVATSVARELWDDEVRRAVAEALDDLEAELRTRLAGVRAALGELSRPVDDNLVARAFAFRVATEVQVRREAARERLAALEPVLSAAAPAERRALLAAAPLPVGMAPVERDDVARAYAQWAREHADDALELVGREDAAWFARRLANDELRRRVREWPRLVAHELVDELPVAAAALLELLDEPLPADPAEDAVWLAFVREELGFGERAPLDGA